MNKCKKGLIKFKAKVRKRLKEQKRELKARLEYANRLNKENNELVELHNQNIKNMQSTINQKDIELSKIKKELKIIEDKRNILLYDIEQERKDVVDLEKDNTRLTLENKDLEVSLNICNNRIKYEFRGE